MSSGITWHSHVQLAFKCPVAPVTSSGNRWQQVATGVNRWHLVAVRSHFGLRLDGRNNPARASNRPGRRINLFNNATRVINPTLGKKSLSSWDSSIHEAWSALRACNVKQHIRHVSRMTQGLTELLYTTCYTLNGTWNIYTRVESRVFIGGDYCNKVCYALFNSWPTRQQ